MRIDVEQVAKLANLPLSDEEKEKYERQLAKILEYFQTLNKVDTNTVELSGTLTNHKPLREDEPGVALEQEKVLGNASLKQNGHFKIKGIFEE